VISRNAKCLCIVAALAILPGCLGGQSYTPQNPLLAGHKPKPWSQTMVEAGKQVGDALKIDPRVDPANDPTKLSTAHKPIGSKLYLRSAKMLEHRGDLQGARSHYERAVQTDPRQVQPLIALARFHDRRSQFDKASEYYQRAVKLDKSHSGACNDLALCLSRSGRIDEAVVALQRAIELKPKKVLYRNNIATVLISANRANEALDHLRAVHPPAIAHYNLGFLLTQQGHHRLARTHLRRAIEMDTTLTAARLVMNKLPAGDQNGNRSQALPVSRPPRQSRQSGFQPINPGTVRSVGDGAAQNIRHLPPVR